VSPRRVELLGDLPQGIVKGLGVLVIERGAGTLEIELDTVHLDRGCDFAFIRESVAESGIEAVIPLRRKAKPRTRRRKATVSLGERWPVERANS